MSAAILQFPISQASKTRTLSDLGGTKAANDAITQKLELSFMEAAIANDSFGYDLPKYIESSWQDRVTGLAKVEGMTQAMSKLMIDRLAWWGAYLDARPHLVADTLLFCPWSGFVALAMYQTVGERKRYHISAFTGKQRPSASFAKKAFLTFAGIEAGEAPYHLNKLNAHQQAAKPFENPLKAGDVLYSTWGIEQTNVTFYFVSAVSGLTVTVQEIEAETEYEKHTRQNEEGELIESIDHMMGYKTPILDAFKGVEMTKKVNSEGYVKINKYERAGALEYTDVTGEKVYKPVRFSAYA